MSSRNKYFLKKTLTALFYLNFEMLNPVIYKQVELLGLFIAINLTSHKLSIQQVIKKVMAKISQKDYLKKYLSSDSKLKKKKKKSKSDGKPKINAT